MNKTINKLLLAGDKFMPEIHLRRPGFTNTACRPILLVLKIEKEYENLKKQEIQDIFIKTTK